MVKVDAFAFTIGVVVGYFFIDFLKSAMRLLTSLPPLVIFLIGLGILYYFRGSHIRLSGDFIMGLGIGLGIRGQFV